MNRTRRSKPRQAAKPRKSPIQNSKNCAVVGIGSSAGGLVAVRTLLANLRPDLGFAYVVVQHLDPVHESTIPAILARETKMPVIHAADKVPVKPNHVYVLPPNKEITIENGVLSLSRRNSRILNLPINTFFNSLAHDKKTSAIAIVLSGTGIDGTEGLETIKNEGGVTFAQDSETARFPEMSASAIQAGVIDFVLPPTHMAAELAKISDHRNQFASPEPEIVGSVGRDFRLILALLQHATGIDFFLYRPATLERRIRRRMLLLRIPSLEEYLKYLKQRPGEIQLLHHEIFIHVTSFFREPKRFEILQQDVFPKAIEGKNKNNPLRIWIPGCSSGEEVYSIAITLLEFLKKQKMSLPIQIFGTDISATAINKARTGIYPQSIESQVSADRRSQFFTKVEGGYQIVKSVRDLCVFARHNLLNDAPFSRIDLISCCNLMIYLETSVQKKLFAIFHYGLNVGGYLMLGKSESASGFSSAFRPIDKTNKIYIRLEGSPLFASFPKNISEIPVQFSPAEALPPGGISFDLQQEADNYVLSRYGHAGLIVNDSMRIVQFRGGIREYLEPVGGEASLELGKMLHKDLRLQLRSMIQTCRKTNESVARANIPLQLQHRKVTVTLETIPLQIPNTRERSYLLLIEQESPGTLLPTPTSEKREKIERPGKIAELRRELEDTRELMRSVIEEQDETNQQINASNEELQSSNEELQSANEELEMTKEQLESTNEELVTLNETLQNRNVELDNTNRQLAIVSAFSDSIIKTMRQPLLILDSALRVKRANPAFLERFYEKEEEIVGCPIQHLKSGIWNSAEFRRAAKDVQGSIVEVRNREFQFELGETMRTFSMNAQRILSQDTSDTFLFAFEDITERKLLQIESQERLLVMEIHHRVKNNLQVISSLLNLQGRQIKDEKALYMIQQCDNRIRSIALIHEKLHRSENGSRVPMKDYVQDMSKSLLQFYEKSRQISLKTDIDEIHLPLDTAIPCGLVLNELVSNSIKHAFPENRKGTIEVTFRRPKTERSADYSLIVKDDGIGLPRNIDPAKLNSLGMQIVTSLIKQIDGKFEVKRRNGTTYQIHFRVPEN